MNKKRVVITGLGVASSVGLGIDETFDALVEKKCGVRRVEAFDPSAFQSQIAGEIVELNVKDFIFKKYNKHARVMARDIELAVAAAYNAIKDAGLKSKCLVDRGEAEAVDIDSTRFGANIGAGLICADLSELAEALGTAAENPAEKGNRRFSLGKWGEAMTNLTPLWLLKFLPNMLACHVTIVHDCQAPSNTITCGEASSHLAIGEAFRTIQRGAADLCICGGAESKVNPMAMIRPELWHRVATNRNHDPARACRPFDADRSGMVVGEGGGLLILEEYEHAKARGARIYGEVCGFGASQNNSSWFRPQPDGRALRLASEKAMADAGVTSDEIDLVNPFGVGTKEHDAGEAAAIRSLFGNRTNEVPVLATKGAIGNNGAGSGAIDIAVVVKAMERGVAPPSLNTDKIDPDCGINVIQNDPIDLRAKTALTFAGAMSGGQTGALVIRRMES
ncbi:MAG: beta-ketoacyl-[acyl-carrier-protein] synthase family protein [Phycisphaerales bacterium]|nr:beta-ketoacyl-[acyl-carrier-protein] synthase family protein [Phycisphaerales bacterium]MCB9854738.1 beta-ketoacyl-[acyl-carrier-protein] synthase family protein [Phycisphaerales bacterium]